MKEECVERACQSKQSALRSMLRRTSGKKIGQDHAAQGHDHAPSAATCPPDKDDIGTHSWTLLHTLAAYYPEEPDEAHATAATSFMHALAQLYPCSECADDLREQLDASPPRVGSRSELSVWLCQVHNRINEKLGKPVYSCDLAALDARWRTGGAHCDAADEELATPSDQGQ